MKRRSERASERARRKAQKESAMLHPGTKSNYARKRIYLKAHGGWGWEYPNKPWRTGGIA